MTAADHQSVRGCRMPATPFLGAEGSCILEKGADIFSSFFFCN
nr:MAG TPA: hypothetical protein [Caudoviricetes sp.]